MKGNFTHPRRNHQLDDCRSDAFFARSKASLYSARLSKRLGNFFKLKLKDMKDFE